MTVIFLKYCPTCGGRNFMYTTSGAKCRDCKTEITDEGKIVKKKEGGD